MVTKRLKCAEEKEREDAADVRGRESEVDFYTVGLLTGLCGPLAAMQMCKRLGIVSAHY